MRHRRQTRATILAGVLLLPGCVMPLPDHGGGDTPVISGESIERLAPGVTQRRDVLLLLGEPTYSAENNRVFVYRWQRVVGVWSAGMPTGGDIKRQRELYLTFNESGMLISRCFSQPGIFDKRVSPSCVTTGTAASAAQP